MVLESLIKGEEARKHPLVMMFLAGILASIGIWASYVLFPANASVLSIGFVTIGIVPILYTIFILEEAAEASEKGKWFSFVSRHFDIIKIYSWFFIGLVLTYSLWYVVLPGDERTMVFSEQNKVIGNIWNLRENLTGNFIGPQEVCGENIWCWFNVILRNNLQVLFWAVMLSLVYGVGAMFLIAWNASVIGALIGQNTIQLVAGYASFWPFEYILAYGHALIKSLGLVPHGFFEVVGYFVGAIAGALISIVVTKGHYRKHELDLLIKDSIGLILIAVIMLIIGAYIEAVLIVG